MGEEVAREEKSVEAVLPERESQGSQNHLAVCLLSNNEFILQLRLVAPK